LSDITDRVEVADNDENHNTMDNWNREYSNWGEYRRGSGHRIYWLIANDIGDGLSILDLGGGCGNEVRYLLNKLPNSTVTVLDISSLAVETGREHCDDIEFICADYNTWTTDKKYDVIIASQFIEHFDDPEFIVRKMMSMLEDGGPLYIGVPHHDIPYEYHQHRFGHDSYHP